MTIELKTRIVTTTPYNVLTKDEVLFINVNGPASVILPINGDDGDEKISFYIKDYSGLARTNPIIITSAGSKTIDGVSFAILNNGYGHIQVVYDGTNWKIIS